MKKLMILGAGIYQAPLIRQAKELGLYVIVVSSPGDYPGFVLADKAYQTDTRDQEGVLEIARSENIDGICTSGTDAAVRTIGYVCQKMGLHGLSYEAACRVTDKALMKDSFYQKKVSTPGHSRASSLEKARQAAKRLGYPLLVKAVDSSGSRGIVIVEKESQLDEAFSRARQVSGKDYVLVEEYIQAVEIGVDGFVKNGSLVFMAPHEKYLFRGEQVTVPAGHSFPYVSTKKQMREIQKQMQLAVEAAGLDECPVNADVLVDGNKVWILEIGGRTGATCIPELISLHYGFPFYQRIIQNALGESVQFPRLVHVPCKGRLLMSPVNAVLTQIDEEKLDGLRNKGVEIVIDYSPGHKVQAMKNGTDRMGHVVAKAASEEEFTAVYDQVQSAVWIGEQTLYQLNHLVKDRKG